MFEMGLGGGSAPEKNWRKLKDTAGALRPGSIIRAQEEYRNAGEAQPIPKESCFEIVLLLNYTV
jgi:hypothetical protein